MRAVHFLRGTLVPVTMKLYENLDIDLFSWAQEQEYNIGYIERFMEVKT